MGDNLDLTKAYVWALLESLEKKYSSSWKIICNSKTCHFFLFIISDCSVFQRRTAANRKSQRASGHHEEMTGNKGICAAVSVSQRLALPEVQGEWRSLVGWEIKSSWEGETITIELNVSNLGIIARNFKFKEEIKIVGHSWKHFTYVVSVGAGRISKRMADERLMRKPVGPTRAPRPEEGSAGSLGTNAKEHRRKVYLSQNSRNPWPKMKSAQFSQDRPEILLVAQVLWKKTLNETIHYLQENF